MQEGIAEAVRAVHDGILQGVAGGSLAAAQEFGIADGSQYPGGSIPIVRGRRQQRPGFPVTGQCLFVIFPIRQGITPSAELADLFIDGVVQFFHGLPLGIAGMGGNADGVAANMVTLSAAFSYSCQATAAVMGTAAIKISFTSPISSDFSRVSRNFSQVIINEDY